MTNSIDKHFRINNFPHIQHEFLTIKIINCIRKIKYESKIYISNGCFYDQEVGKQQTLRFLISGNLPRVLRRVLSTSNSD